MTNWLLNIGSPWISHVAKVAKEPPPLCRRPHSVPQTPCMRSPRPFRHLAELKIAMVGMGKHDDAATILREIYDVFLDTPICLECFS